MARTFNTIDNLVADFGPMTVGAFIRAFREADEFSQVEFARRLALSRANLCDIELGRKLVSPHRAAGIAKKLGVPEQVLVQLALQDSLRESHLNYSVELRPLAPTKKRAA